MLITRLFIVLWFYKILRESGLIGQSFYDRANPEQDKVASLIASGAGKPLLDNNKNNIPPQIFYQSQLSCVLVTYPSLTHIPLFWPITFDSRATELFRNRATLKTRTVARKLPPRCLCSETVCPIYAPPLM